ncbi:MAG: xanthine dehydrogenase family protein molybdopterin-binding subunit [Pseudomonadota bacterium]
MATRAIPPGAAIGRPLDRVDGLAKVTGQARYSADVPAEGVAFAVAVNAAVARGRVASIDTSRALAHRGVLTVITHADAPWPDHAPARTDLEEPEGGVLWGRPDQGLHLVLRDDRVRYPGQPIAVVVAETLEAAEYGAKLVSARYEAQIPRSDLDAALRTQTPFLPPGSQLMPAGDPVDTRRGDPETALAQAAHTVDQDYSTPMEHHQQMEPHATLAEWRGDRLTLHDASQGVHIRQGAIAAAFGLPRENVRVISKFVGGGFGGKGRAWPHVVLAALAARAVARPVKLVLSRDQMSSMVGYRAAHRQRLRLGADADGRLTAIAHDNIQPTAAHDTYLEATAKSTRALYACPNVSTSHRLVRFDVGVPTSTRAPGKAPGIFALESAMDELAFTTGIDPIELRLTNYAETDPRADRPWSSKGLRACYAVGADRFGWESGPIRPRRRREEPWLIGRGMASSVYPGFRAPATARCTLHPDGTAHVESGTLDFGVGTYTTMAQVAAETLGLPFEKVRFDLGDSALPEAPVIGSSRTMASVGSAVRAACQQARAAAVQRAPDSDGDLAAALATIDVPLTAEASVAPGDEWDRFGIHAFGAHFCEVGVDADTGIVRIRRYVTAMDGGRIINPKLARSQIVGGVIWGIGMALMEETRTDLVTGQNVNTSFADYLIPVNADIPDIDVVFVEPEDRHANPLGVKGIGELGIVGAAGAIANAVFDATGLRIHDLPISPDKLLAAL